MMRRFLWCIPSRKRIVKEDSDSERAESPGFVAEPDPVDDLQVGKLDLRESPDSYPAHSRVATDLWCDKTTTDPAPVSLLWTPASTRRRASRELLDVPATRTPPDRTISWHADDVTITSPPRMQLRDRTLMRPIREFPSYKDAEKRKNPGADMPAEKKARTEPSSFCAAVSESESD